MRGLILSLCDYSGVWSRPYVEAGYEVVILDIEHASGERTFANGLTMIGADVTKFDIAHAPHGVLAAPPCTCFCRPSARWQKQQDASGQTARDIAIMRACLRLCACATGWWAMENPPGRHQSLIPELGPPAWQFQPYEYGHPWAKQTYIWGTAKKPEPTNIVKPPPNRRTPNGKTQGRIAFMSSSWKNKRSETPSGFARAFFAANQ